MALPNSNITTTLVGNTLGSGSRDVGTLCTHANVNKWSKWKPIRNNKVVGLNEYDLSFANFGLAIPFFNSRADLIAHYTSTPQSGWPYTKPSGGPSSPFRLGDFRNYEHSASRFYHVSIPDRVIGGGYVHVEIGSYPSSLHGLGWSDFTLLDLENMRFGATASNGQTVIVDNSLLDGGVSYLSIPVTGDVTSYAFIALMLDGNITRYYALENGCGFTEYLSSAVSVTMDNTFMYALGRMITSLTLTSLAYTNTLQNVSIQVRYDDNEPTDPLEAGEAIQSFGNITVVNGTPQIRDFTFNNVLPDYDWRSGYIYFSCTSHPELNQRFGFDLI